jgi:hypothetical protein
LASFSLVPFASYGCAFCVPFPFRCFILSLMEASHFDEAEFFGAIAARAMLIGRRALIALGLPLLTRDYDFMKRPEPMLPLSSEALERVRKLTERRLSDAEFDAYVNAPMSEAEREEILASVAWFTKRYPTPAERLAAARRAYNQWARGMPGGGSAADK